MSNEFKHIQKTLAKLPIVIRQKVVTGAARRAARVIEKEAESIVAQDTGALKASIGVAKAKKKDTPDDVVRYYIVPKSVLRVNKRVKVNGQAAKLKAKTHLYYAHFLEFGFTLRDGTKHAGNPFLLPAARAKKDEALKEFRDYTIIRTEKEVKRLAR